MALSGEAGSRRVRAVGLSSRPDLLEFQHGGHLKAIGGLPTNPAALASRQQRSSPVGTP
jgi:hypothetical protein